MTKMLVLYIGLTDNIYIFYKYKCMFFAKHELSRLSYPCTVEATH